MLGAGLGPLRRCFAWIFTFTGIVNVIVMIVMRLMVAKYVNLVEDLSSAGHRQMLSQVRTKLRDSGTTKN